MESWALLDVQFKVGGQFPGVPPGLVNPSQVAANVGQANRERNALLVNSGIVLRLQQSGHRPAAQQPAVKAGAFLVGEYHHLHRMAQGIGVVGQGLDCLNRAQNAQRAVIFAAVRHGVGVGAEGNGRQIGVGAGLAPDDIAGRVNAGFQPGPAHQV